MAQSITNSIRIIPRDENFLNRIVGASGEIFFNRDENTLRLYDGNNRGGFTVVSDANISTILGTNGVASLEYTVTVAGPQGVDTGNKYILSGVYKPELQMVMGYTYVFDQSNQTNEYYPNPEGGANNQHPINLSADDPNGELGAGTVYETNVKYQLDGKEVTKEIYNGSKFAAATERKVFLLVTADTPTTLYYYCSRHLNMGNTISVVEPGGGAAEAASIAVGETAPEEPVVGNIWFNNSTGVLYIRSDDESGDEFWVQPSVPQTNAFTQFTVDTTTLAPSDSADELTFVAGSNVTLTADDAGNTITIAATGGGGATYDQDLNTTDDVTFNSVTAPSFTNSGVGAAVLESASSLTLTAPDGVIVTSGPFRLPCFDDTGRDALAAVNGDVIYNSQNNRPEMYVNGSWVIVSTEPIV